MAGQFENLANPDYHYETTAQEIYEQMDGKVDAVVLGCGTCGTFSGVARLLKQKSPRVLAVAVETQGSILGGGKPGPHKVEGIGSSFIPKTFDPSVCDEVMQDKIAIGGEESAGLSIRHHVPEKDGVLAGLLCCESVARRGKSLGEQLKAISDKVGSYYPMRENFRLTPEVKAKFTEKLKSDPREFCGHPVSEVVRTDGLKLVFSDGSWVCYRLSGTEPVVRAYTEARSEKGLEKLSTAAKKWIFE